MEKIQAKVHAYALGDLASQLPDEVISLNEGFEIATMGTVRCKTKSMLGGAHALLGHATIRAAKQKDYM